MPCYRHLLIEVTFRTRAVEMLVYLLVFMGLEADKPRTFERLGRAMVADQPTILLRADPLRRIISFAKANGGTVGPVDRLRDSTP